ncbi:MAG: hypothetical protein WD004_05845 [Actinomycetota bacterium]
MTTTHEHLDHQVRLRIPPLLRHAFQIYRRRFWRVALSAIVVFVPITVIEVAAEPILEDPFEHGFGVVTALVLALITGFLASFGEIFYAGLLDEVVGSDLQGKPLPSTATVMRDLPWVRLLLADLVFVAVVGVGFVLAVIPGIVAFVLFGLVGAVINIERRGVFASFRRTASLVARRFILVGVLILVPTAVESVVDDWFIRFEHDASWVAVIGVSALIAVAVGSVVGLIEVTLAHVLIARDRARKAGEAAAQGTSSG